MFVIGVEGGGGTPLTLSACCRMPFTGRSPLGCDVDEAFQMVRNLRHELIAEALTKNTMMFKQFDHCVHFVPSYHSVNSTFN